MAELRRTLCNRDCPDVCGMVARVEDGRVTQLTGDKDHPVTRGFLCHRTSHFLPRQYDPQRIVTPQLRRGDGFVEVGWDDALDLAAEHLARIRRESGPAAVLHYRSGGNLGMLLTLTDHFFEQWGPVTMKRGDICSGGGDAAQLADFGEEDSHALEDLLNARNILLWGKNVFVSNLHAVPVLKAAQAKGAHLTLVDPVHTRTTRLADVYVQPRPGGDLALCMAVARVLFEQGWVGARARAQCDHVDAFRALAMQKDVEAWCQSADVAPQVAHDLAARLHQGPTAIVVGWGMQRRVNGAAIVRALDALCALSGNLGISGGGVGFYFKRRGAFDETMRRGEAAAPRTLCEPQLGRGILDAKDPPIRAVWVTAGNPVAMLPESHVTAQALRTREFVVVADSHWTDTARLAHLVLPTPTLLEQSDLLGSYGHQYIGASTAVVDPPPHVRTDLHIMQGLAQRLGLADVMAGSTDQWRERLLAPKTVARGVSLRDLTHRVVARPDAPQVLFADGKVNTPNGRVQLMNQWPALADGLPAQAAYPLYLMSVSTDRSQASQWNQAPQGPAEVTVHPSSSPVPDGALALLQSELGELRVRVKHDADQRADVCLMPKGGDVAGGRSANALVVARITDMGEGAALYDQRVRLVPAEGL
jgi:anaerobic selenocysteine-containing dehydrogenase